MRGAFDAKGAARQLGHRDMATLIQGDASRPSAPAGLALGALQAEPRDEAGTGPSSSVSAPFGHGVGQVSREDLAHALAAAFRSEVTPPFAQLVAVLFNSSDPQQRAGVLGELVPSISLDALSRIAGGTLARALAASPSRSIARECACRLSPFDVSAIAAHAARHDPSIIDRLGFFYSQYPALVKALGTVTVDVVMRHLQSRQ